MKTFRNKKLMAIAMALIVAMLLTGILAASSLWVSAATEFDGAGTDADPYIIKTADDLAKFAELVNAGDTDYNAASYELAGNISLSRYLDDLSDPEGWTPIGDKAAGRPFMGTFDGAGYAVLGLWIDRPDVDAQGLFGYVKNGTIKNLGVYVSSEGIDGQMNVGALVGRLTSADGETSTIDSCFSTGGPIKGTETVGGLIGYAYAGFEGGSSTDCTLIITKSITTCSVTYNGGAAVKNDGEFGGFAGSIGAGNTGSTATVTNCAATGDVNSGVFQRGHAGGFAGSIWGNTTISYCYATGDVSCEYRFGGFIGGADGFYSDAHAGPYGPGTGIPAVDNCFSTGKVHTAPGASQYGGFSGDGIIATIDGITYKPDFDNCYFDIENNPGLVGDGAWSNFPGSSPMIEVTTAQITDGTLLDAIDHDGDYFEADANGFPTLGALNDSPNEMLARISAGSSSDYTPSPNDVIRFDVATGMFTIDTDDGTQGNYIVYTGQPGFWSWDAASSTLTLFDGFTWTANLGLYIEGDITIEIFGEVTIADTAADHNVHALVVEGDLVITGDGILNVDSVDGAGIYTTGSLYIENVEVNAGCDYGMYVVSGDFTLDNATFTVAAADPATIAGLWVANGNVIITDGSVVSIVTDSIAGSAAIGIAASDDVIITDSDVTISSDGNGIVTAAGSVEITDSTVTIDAGTDGIHAVGGALVVVSSTLDITADRDGIYATGAVTITGSDTDRSDVTIDADAMGINAVGSSVISTYTDFDIISVGNGIYTDTNVDIANSSLVIDSGAIGIKANGGSVLLTDTSADIVSVASGIDALTTVSIVKVALDTEVEIDAAAHGIKAGTAVSVSGGSALTIKATMIGINAGTSVAISDSSFKLTTAGDGIFTTLGNIAISGVPTAGGSFIKSTGGYGLHTDDASTAVTITSSDFIIEAKEYGIYSKAGLVITGTGAARTSLSVKSSAASVGAIYALTGNISIDYATVTVPSTGATSFGISAPAGSIAIGNASAVTVTSTDSAIKAKTGVSVTGESVVAATTTIAGAHGIYVTNAGDIVVTSSSVSSTTAGANANGIYAASGNVTVTGTRDLPSDIITTAPGAGSNGITAGNVSLSNSAFNIAASNIGIYTSGATGVTISGAPTKAPRNAIASGAAAIVTNNVTANVAISASDFTVTSTFSGIAILADVDVSITDDSLVTVTTASVYGIYASRGDITIESSEVSIINTRAGGTAICAEFGSVVIDDSTVTTTSVLNGISAETGLSITGESTVAVTVTTGGADTMGICTETNDITIDASTVTLTAAGCYYGICSLWGETNISDSTVSSSAGYFAIGGATVTITEDSQVTSSAGTAGIAIYADSDDITIADSTVTVTAAGLFAINSEDGSVYIENSTVTTTSVGYGIIARIGVSITDDSVVTITTTGAAGIAIYALSEDITVSESEIAVTTGGASSHGLYAAAGEVILDETKFKISANGHGIFAPVGVTITDAPTVAAPNRNSITSTNVGILTSGAITVDSSDFAVAAVAGGLNASNGVSITGDNVQSNISIAVTADSATGIYSSFEEIAIDNSIVTITSTVGTGIIGIQTGYAAGSGTRNISITGGSEVTISVSGYGINTNYTGSTVTVDGSEVTITSGNTAIDTKAATITDSELDLASTAGSGIRAFPGALQITSSNVDIIAAQFGIYAASVTIDTDSDVEIASNVIGIAAATTTITITDSVVEITTTNNGGRGMQAVTGATITDSTVTITTAGNLATGIEVTGGAIVVSGSTVTIDTAGDGADGMFADSSVTIEEDSDVTITTAGQDSVGIYSDYSYVAIDDSTVTITTTGDSSTGIYALTNITVEDSIITITTDSALADGIATDGYVTIDASVINIDAGYSGIFALGNITIKDVPALPTSSIVGADEYGINANNTGASVSIENSTIRIGGKRTAIRSAAGVDITDASDVTAYTVNGDQTSFGIQARNDNVNINGASTVTVTSSGTGIWSAAMVSVTEESVVRITAGTATFGNSVYGIYGSTGVEIIDSEFYITSVGTGIYAATNNVTITDVPNKFPVCYVLSTEFVGIISNANSVVITSSIFNVTSHSIGIAAAYNVTITGTSVSYSNINIITTGPVGAYSPDGIYSNLGYVTINYTTLNIISASGKGISAPAASPNGKVSISTSSVIIGSALDGILAGNGVEITASTFRITTATAGNGIIATGGNVSISNILTSVPPSSITSGANGILAATGKVTITNATFNINAGAKGIYAPDATNGLVDILAASKISVQSVGSGIETSGTVTISGASIVSVKTTGAGSRGVYSTASSIAVMGPNTTLAVISDGDGISAFTTVDIVKSTVTVDATGTDSVGIFARTTVNATSSILTISSNGSGIVAGTAVTIGGTSSDLSVVQITTTGTGSNGIVAGTTVDIDHTKFYITATKSGIVAPGNITITNIPTSLPKSFITTHGVEGANAIDSTGGMVAITSAVFDITAVGRGINAAAGVVISTASNINITSGNIGINATTGGVEIDLSTVTIIAGADGIVASPVIITTSTVSVNANGTGISSTTYVSITAGSTVTVTTTTGDGINAGTTIDIDSSAFGIVAGGSGLYAIGDITISNIAAAPVASSITATGIGKFGIYSGDEFVITNAAFAVTAASGFGIYGVDGVTIEENSDITISCSRDAVSIEFGDIVITSSILTITSSEHGLCIFDAPGPGYEGNIIITDSTVSIVSTEIGIYSNSGDLTVSGSTLTVVAGDCGIFLFDGSISISDSEVDITAQGEYGIWVYDGNITIVESIVSVDEANVGIEFAIDLVIFDSTIVVNAVIRAIESYDVGCTALIVESTLNLTAAVGIDVEDGTITITESDVTINATTCGILADDVAITDSTIDISVAWDGTYGICAENGNIVIDNSNVTVTGVANANLKGLKGLVITSDDCAIEITNDSEVTLTNCTFGISVAKGDILINDSMFTATECLAGIKIDEGSITFEAGAVVSFEDCTFGIGSTGLLITNVAITDSVVSFVNVAQGISVVYGDITINNSNVDIDATRSGLSIGEGNLYIIGNSTVTIDVDSGVNPGQAIYIEDGNFTLTNSSLTIASAGYAYGIYLNSGDFTITDSTIVGTGEGLSVIYVEGDLSLVRSSINATLTSDEDNIAAISCVGDILLTKSIINATVNGGFGTVSYAIYTDGIIELNESAVSAVNTNANENSYGIFGSIAFEGLFVSTVEAQGATQAFFNYDTTTLDNSSYGYKYDTAPAHALDYDGYYSPTYGVHFDETELHVYLRYLQTITLTGRDKTITYNPNNPNTTSAELFTAPTYAGIKSYELLDTSTGVCTSFNPATGAITGITKAGTFVVRLTTDPTVTYGPATCTVTITVNRAQQPTFGWTDELPTLTYGDAPIDLYNFLKQNADPEVGGLYIDFISNDPTLLTFNGSVATIKKPGTLTVNITKDGDDLYLPRTMTLNLVINKKNQPPVTVSTSQITKEFISYPFNFFNMFAESFSVAGGEPGVGHFVFSSSNPAVLTVNGNGRVDFFKAGEAKIIVIKTGNEYYNDSEPVEVTVTITQPELEPGKPGAQPLRIIASPSVASYAPDLSISLTVTGGGGTGALSFKAGYYEFVPGENGDPDTYVFVEDDSVISIDPVTGAITVNGAGTVTIVATKEADETYPESSAATTITIKKAIQQNSVSVLLSQNTITYGGAAPTVTVTGGFGDVDSVKSSNEHVFTVSINDDGEIIITVVGAGTATLTVTTTGDENHYPASGSATLTINKATQPPIHVGGETEIDLTCKYGDASFFLPAIEGGAGGGMFIYTLVDGNGVITVSQFGVITVLKSGTATVKVTKAGDGNYRDGEDEVIFNITVKKADQKKVNATVNGSALVFNTAPNATVIGAGGSGTGAIKYSVPNGSKFSIDEDTGVISGLTGAGSVVVTVTKLGDANYEEASTTITVVVGKSAQATLPTTATNAYTIPYGTPTALDAITGGIGTLVAVNNSPNVIDFTFDAATGIITVTTVKKIGSATISVYASGNDDYLAGAPITITITTAKAAYPGALTSATVNKTYGDAAFNLSVGNVITGGRLVYTNNNPSIISVSADGKVTILSAGTATVGVKCVDPAGFYNDSAELVITINVAKKAQTTLQVDGGSSKTYNKTYGNAPFQISSFTGGSGTGKITYSYTSSAVSIDANGYVTITGATASTVAVTIKKVGDANYTDSNTVTVNINVAKANQTPISVTANPGNSAVYGTSTVYSVIAAGGSGTGAYGFTSNATSVVAVNPTTGALTIGNVGTATITVTKAGDDNYNAAVSATVTIVVVKADQPDVTPGVQTFTKKFGDVATFNLGIGGGAATGTFVCTSSDTGVVTVTDAGVVTVVGAGYATITVNKTDANYNDITTVYGVNIEKGDQTVTTDRTTYTATYDGSVSILTGGVGSGALSYRSSNNNVVSINASGVVTITGVGSATITITRSATSNYNSASAVVTVDISKANQTALNSDANEVSATYGIDTTIDLYATCGITGGSGTGIFTYVTSDPKVVTVNGSGVVTIIGRGTATITISKAGDKNYNVSNTLVIEIDVAAGTQSSISFIDDTTAKNQNVVFGNAGFNVPTIKGGNGGGELIFTSNNPSFVEVDKTGRITIKHATTAPVTITIYKKGDANYNDSNTITFTVSVAKATQGNILLTSSKSSVVYGAAVPTLTISGTTVGEVSYTTSNEGAIVVDSTGKVYVEGVGTATITATFAGNDDYLPASVKVTITVTKASQSAFALNSSTLTPTYLGTAPTLTTSGGDSKGTVTFVSSNTNVITVTADGKISIIGAGVAKITATNSGSANYNEASASVTITVGKANQPALTYAEAYFLAKCTANTQLTGVIGGAGTGKLVYGVDGTTSDYTITASGLVTALKAGTSAQKITVYREGDANYSASAVLKIELRVAKVPTAEISAPYFAINGPFTTIYAPNKKIGIMSLVGGVFGGGGTGAFTYAISGTGATINATTGEITTTGVGVVNISVKRNGDANYSDSPFSAIITLTITRGSIIAPTFASNKVTKTYGDAKFDLPTLSVVGTYAYTSSNTNVAIVDETGKVTIVGAGSAVISANLLSLDLNLYDEAAPATIEIVVGKKSVTLTGITVANKVYDGKTTATISGNGTLSGKVIGDDLTFTVGTASFGTPGVGENKDVYFGGFALTGADAGNYVFTQPESAKANITKATLTVTLKKTYTIALGQSMPYFELTYTGFVEGDGNWMVTKAPTTTCTGTAVGTHEVKIAGGESSNYTFVYVSGSLVITVAPVNVVAISGTIGTAEKLSEINYTTASWNAFVTALNAAKAAVADEDATQEEVNAAKAALETAMNSLERPEAEQEEEPSNVWLIVILATAGVAVVVLVVVIIVRKKK